MIIVTKLFSKISDQRFIIVFSALISLVFGFGLFKATGNWLIIPISILIQFLIIKYWIIPLWGNEIDEKKRELKIELMVFEESKKNNLSTKKDQ
jgi:Flp pilus assembly protein TadB